MQMTLPGLSAEGGVRRISPQHTYIKNIWMPHIRCEMEALGIEDRPEIWAAARANAIADEICNNI